MIITAKTCSRVLQREAKVRSFSVGDVIARCVLVIQEEGFQPGGASLHSMMTSHGPDAQCFEVNSTMPLTPRKIAEGTMVLLHFSAELLALPA